MAQAVSSPTLSSFIAQLTGPIQGTSIEVRRFSAELRREAEAAWTVAYHRYHAATSYASYCSHTRTAAQRERRTLNVPEAAAVAQAELDRISAADRLMMTPAPTTTALRMKKKMRDYNGGRDRWEAAIAADEARLG